MWFVQIGAIIITRVKWDYFVFRNQYMKREEKINTIQLLGIFLCVYFKGGRCDLVMSLSRSHSKLSQILIKFSAITISMKKSHFFPVITVQVYLQWLLKH